MRKYIFYKNKVCLTLLVTLQTLRTAGTVGVAVLINYLIDAVSKAIQYKQTWTLGKCAVVCCIYALLLGLIILLGEKVAAITFKRTLLNIRSAALDGILSIDVAEMQKTNSAEYVTLLNQSISVYEESYLKNLLSIYDSILGMLIAVGLLLYINPIVAVISIIAMAVPGFIPKLFSGKMGSQQGKIIQDTTAYTAKVKDILTGYEVIKAYRISDLMSKKHTESASEMEQSKVALANTTAWLYGFANMASISVQFLIMTLCGIFAVRGLVTIGSIVAVTQLTGQVISPAFQLSTKFSQLKSTEPIRNQIDSIISLSGASNDTEEPKELKQVLSLDNISFSYGDSPVLRQVQAQIDRGKKYAIVGKSGSGKSTLLKIIAGYYKDYSGTILIDGEPARSCSQSLISQNIFLFDDTIKNNITLYRNYSDDSINKVIHMAGLSELISRLENGLDTEVEENGARFSGGEKQRIAIARALLHGKSLLMLDEATSSLDNERAQEIEENILGLKNITCISVTHKLYSNILRMYDKIFVMDEGRIVEQGPFEELIKNNGLFQKLYATGIG